MGVAGTFLAARRGAHTGLLPELVEQIASNRAQLDHLPGLDRHNSDKRCITFVVAGMPCDKRLDPGLGDPELCGKIRQPHAVAGGANRQDCSEIAKLCVRQAQADPGNTLS